uniref:Uncharacterized protein n=1 Tax=Heterorhabditis bacteriophora TaxID=37862 RepID=A0A1I7XUI4_HETBA
MDLVVETYGTYRREFEDTFNGLRHRGQVIQKRALQFLTDTRAQVNPQKQKLVQLVSDTSDINIPHKVVVGTFAWASVLILGASIGSFLGSFVLDLFISCFVGKVGAAVLAFLIIPIYAYNTIKKDEAAGVPDAIIRFSLLFLAIIQGILAGHTISSSYLSAQPLAFFTPAVIALTFPVIHTLCIHPCLFYLLFQSIAHSIGTNRVSLFCGVLGTALTLNLLLGAVAGYLTTAYFLLTVLYISSASIVLQFVCQDVKYNEVQLHTYQLALLILFVLVKNFVFLTFGSQQYVESFKKGEDLSQAIH